MLKESSILENNSNLILIFLIITILFYQNLYFASITTHNKDLINLNKETLSMYKDLIENQLNYTEDVHYIRLNAEALEKENKELLEKVERLNDTFFDQTH